MCIQKNSKRDKLYRNAQLKKARFFMKIPCLEAVQKRVPYLIRDVQMQVAQKTEPLEVYRNTLSGAA